MKPNTPEALVPRERNLAVVHRLYDAFGSNDASTVIPLLTEDFVSTVSEGMPNGLGGVYHGNAEAVSNIWGRFWSLYYAHGQPTEFLPVDDDRVVVLGRYVDPAWDGHSTLDAAFAHVITVRGDRVAAMQQITDTAQWQQFRARERDHPRATV